MKSVASVKFIDSNSKRFEVFVIKGIKTEDWTIMERKA